MELLHKELTSQVIGIYYKVFNTLGYGFLEKVYENAISVELRKAGLNFIKQHPIDVYYENEHVGHYVADLYIEECIDH